MMGTLIYAKDSYGIYEVDGEKHQVLSSFPLTCMAHALEQKGREIKEKGAGRS